MPVAGWVVIPDDRKMSLHFKLLGVDLRLFIANSIESSISDGSLYKELLEGTGEGRSKQAIRRNEMKRMILVAVLCVGLAGGTLAASTGDIKGLNADGPAREYAEKLMLFGQFVGDWEFDMVLICPDGTRLKGNGEWHFGWVLEGRAIQDVWIARDDISKPNAPFTEWGTTLRFYDPRTDAWHVVWAGPMRENLITFTGKKIGEEIVMEVDSVQGLPRTNSSEAAPMRRGRWIFDQIAADSFHWRQVTSHDGGKTWELQQEMFVRRMKGGSNNGTGRSLLQQ